MDFFTRLNKAPHIDVKIASREKVDFHGALVATWTDNFDCKHETEFWYCIKDDPFDPSRLNSKKRYYVTLGNRNFTTRVIDPNEYAEELYSVYTESFKGYQRKVVPDTRDQFQKSIDMWNTPEWCLFGVFDNESGKLCGFSDVALRYPYLPFSSFKTLPEYERKSVNFALLTGICNYFEEDLKNGAYLCDGWRNSLHETQFQDFLGKYYGFRRAYCDLHIAYRWYLKPIIAMLFPVRKLFRGKVRQLYALLKMEAWSRGIKED